MEMMKCECGCGGEFELKLICGKPQHFLAGHNRRGKSNWWKIKDEVTWWTSRERARKVKKSDGVCEWKDVGGCGGPVDVAHVDGDAFNNDLSNLKSLCHCHRFLLDGKRIDPSDSIMPRFYVSSGKRRYEFSYGQNGMK